MKQQQFSFYFRTIFVENFTYKVISLLISLLLWFVVFNRKDFIFTRDIDVQFQMDASQTISAQTADRVRVRFSGPRNLIKSFSDSAFSKKIKINMAEKGAGLFDVDITGTMIDVPKGIRILSIRPNLIRLEVNSQLEQK